MIATVMATLCRDKEIKLKKIRESRHKSRHYVAIFSLFGRSLLNPDKYPDKMSGFQYSLMGKLGIPTVLGRKTLN